MIKKKNRAIFLPTNIPKLQNLIKKDPESYREDFFIQWRHYEAMRDIFIENTNEKNEDFLNLIIFISQMCSCFPKETEKFPNDMATLLLNFKNNLHSETKEKIIQALVLLRNKNIISSAYLLKIIFPVLSSSNTKSLHMRIFAVILSEIKNANLKSCNNKINKMGKTILYEIIQKNKDESFFGFWAVKLCQKLWNLKLWNDTFTVEIMKEAVLHPNTKIMIAAINFFLSIDNSSDDSDNSEENNQKNINNLNHKLSINKKNKRKMKKISKTNIRKKRNKKKKSILKNFSAIELLQDPQGFAEKIFSKYFSKKNSHLILKHKLLLLQLLTNLINAHKLNILGIYTLLLKYLNPNQKNVTHFITCTAQACHELIPPDDIEPIIEKIAAEFVIDSVGSEIVALGLNGIRAICSKQPLAIKKELLQSLSKYKKSKYKDVMLAARSLIKLYREVAPELLEKKDRGKTTNISLNKRKSLKFGEGQDIQKSIERLKLLEEWIKKNKYNVNNYNTNRENDIKEQMNKRNIIIDTEEQANTETKLSKYTNNNEDMSKNNFQRIAIKKNTNNPHDLAISTIFTLDFSELQELKEQKNISINKNQSLLKRKITHEYIDNNNDIEKYYKKSRNYEKNTNIEKNHKNKTKFISRKIGQTKINHSTTNKEKSRRKNFMMFIHKKLTQKNKRKLINKQKSKKHDTKKKYIY
ncbi:hypothetical protein PNEG_02849 [Pneumocystis murina B123]|uniref:Protein SDA1 n=1 Tax=Pneumocystis murina (strain B123) TaxID=1069680 RepID=M7NN67_PNEMU|nr:hypothetical protein PNEG_02849 [Pneumocystis murina B123]EMR08672.1 hypothetical protein PNEG_02849 [Pneumocystis murina B123]